MISSVNFLNEFISQAKQVVITDPIKDALENFRTDRIKGAPVAGPVKLDPHQVRPFLALFNEEVREVTNMACPQIGKSWPWQIAIAVKMLHGAYKGWILYQDEDVMKEVNREIIQPLLKSNPKLRKQMSKPGAVGVEKLSIDEAVLIYSSIINEPASHFVHELYLSEIDRTQQKIETRWKNYDACGPRVARFDAFKKSKKLQESSPSTEDNVIWQRFICGTMEYWHWQCVHCGFYNLAHMVSGGMKKGKFWGGLQWEKDDYGEIVSDSLRLHCYECNYAHIESEHYKQINLTGKYIAKHPERIEHESFQAGCFAGAGANSGSPSKPWIRIAEAFRAMKKRNSYSARLSFDNHYRGLPYQKRAKKEDDKQVNLLLKHRGNYKGDGSDISIILITADTQAKHFVYTVFAVDKYMNSWTIESEMDTTKEGMIELWDREFFELKPESMMIDRGGHRKEDVLEIIEACGPGCFGYIGNSRTKYKHEDDLDKILYPTGKYWAWSTEEESLLLADPNIYRCELLFELYDKTDPEEGRFIYIPEEWKEDSWQVSQITACRPPKGYENVRVDYAKWNSGTHDHRTDDVFDTFKMFLILLDVAKKESNWRHNIDFVTGEVLDETN